MTQYNLIETQASKRTYADVANRRSLLSFTVKEGSAGTKTSSVPILRAGAVYTTPRRTAIDPTCDSCLAVDTTLMASINISGAYADKAELRAHLDELVARFIQAANDYNLMGGFLPPLDAFGSEVTPSV